MDHDHASPESRELAALGVGLMLYSLVFLAILGYGWYHLVQGSMPPLLAPVLAVLLALLAWTLARVVGGNAGGIAGNKGLFAALLLLSAIGVFNTLMIKLEGRAIFTEVIDESSRRFGALPALLAAGSANPDIARLRARVAGLETQLRHEIVNPRNCGDGPEAGKILAELRTLLPGFIRYSGAAGDCSKNAEFVRMYSAQIDELLHGSPLFVQANVRGLEALDRQLAAQLPRERARLERLRKQVAAGAGMATVRPALEDSASAYQALAQRLADTVPRSAAQPGFRATLDIAPARNLGEWGHLLPLFVSRIDRAQTWVYLAVAVFLDWLLVHLFFRIASHRRALPARRVAFPRMPQAGTVG